MLPGGEGEKIIPLIASGFLDTTRVSQGDARMWRDICLTNQGSIVTTLGRFKQAVSQWEQVINDGQWDKLGEMFAEVKEWRERR